MYSGGDYWCDCWWFWERWDFLWQSYVPIHLELFREYIWDIGPTPLHVCQVGKKPARFCSLTIPRPGETNWETFLYITHSGTNILCETEGMCFCDHFRWSSWKRPGVRCSSCAQSSGPCPWTAVLFCLCQTFRPDSRSRSASPQLTCAS